MSAAQFRGKSRLGYVYVPSTPQHRYKLRATGTKDPRVVKRIKRLLKDLAHDSRWAVLNAVHEDQVTLLALWDAHQHNRVADLLARATAPELSAHIEPWLLTYRANGGAENNIGVYRQRVTALVQPGFTAIDLAPARVTEWLTGIPGTSGTRRHYLMALKSFVRYLRTVGVVQGDPLLDVQTPKKNPPRRRWASLATDVRVVEAAPDALYRCLFAYIHGTGADHTATVEKIRRADIDLERGIAIVRATKTGRRDRHVLIEPWALPFMRPHLATLLPGALVFEGVTRYMGAWHHEKACASVQVEDYQLRDARHSVAMRMLAAGKSHREVADQLGTSVWQVVNTYGAHDLTLEERLSGQEASPVRARARR